MTASPTLRAVRAPGRGRAVSRRLVSLCRAWCLPWSLAAVLFVVYGLVSLRLQQRQLTAGFDLGYFEQAVRSWAHAHRPVVDVFSPGFPELGDHFSPILVTLAPFYRLWPSPYVLLFGQAALFAVAVVPLSRWALRALGTVAAVAVGVGYGLSWGIAAAVGFDFHEIAFAVPLLSFSLCALGQGRLRAGVLWALPLLLVKEDLGLTVAVIGLLVAWRGGRRGPSGRRLGAVWAGLATASAGVGGTLLEVFVVLPALSPLGSYHYADKVPPAPDGATQWLYRGTVGLLSAPAPKPVTLILLLAPAAFFALRSPLVLVAVPTLLWRFGSGNSMFWGTEYHYSATLMPVVFAAFVDGLVRRPVDVRTLRQLLATSVGVTLLLLPQFALFQLCQPVTWQTPPRVAGARAVLRLIPDGATVAASNRLVPQLTRRATVTLFGRPPVGSVPRSRSGPPEWIVVDTERPTEYPFSGDEQARALAVAVAHGYHRVTDRDGYLLLRAPSGR